jgi:hypothetical protein
LNIKIEVRNDSGNQERTNIGVRARTESWGQQDQRIVNAPFAVGVHLRITVAKTEKDYGGNIAQEEAAEYRRAISQTFDNAGVMKLGSAHFSVVSINTSSTEEEDMSVVLVVHNYSTGR